MSEVLTAAQMRAIERTAIEGGDVTGLELMERAGRGVVAAIFEEWPELANVDGGAAPEPPEYLQTEEGGQRAVVLCGPGNNGGDGFVVARLLKERGWAVQVFLYGDAGKLPVDARMNYQRWLDVGNVRALDPKEVHDCDASLWIDAIFGTGLARPVPEVVYWALSAAGENCASGGGRLVAVDIASWLCADSGRVLGGASYPGCDLVVSFHSYKCGHFLSDGPEACARVVVADIGLSGLASGAPDLIEYDNCSAAMLGKFAGHKYSHGHALVLSGGVGKGGAARLAARGALRIGAGVVTVGCPPGALQENAGALDAVMLRSVKGADGLVEALQDERINALCLGPGFGVGEKQAALVAAALVVGEITHPTGNRRAVVLDADALTALAGGAGLFGKLHENCVLTPHAGEFARMFPDIAEKLNAPAVKGPAYSKVDATREAAARAGCVVLFKGADTVIADPSGRCSINSAHYERSAPWLATAGSGDVLAGFIAGLLARGFGPMQAAETGAWLHVECALEFGPGLIAEDLPEMLPAVFRKLGV